MKDQTPARPLRILICALVLTLVFEGVVRKLVGGSMKTVVFFVKDFLVLLIAFKVSQMPKAAPIQALWRAYLYLLFLFFPAVLATAFRDPLLAVFGAERYLLMPFVAFGIYGAFENVGMDVIRSYARKLGFLLIPITLLAMVQLRLPDGHWLNGDIAGGSTEGFSAGGKLRISATFSFNAQLAMFLTMQVMICAIILNEFKRLAQWQKVVYGALPFALLMTSYATGSRSAVLGNAAVIGIAVLFGVWKGHRKGLMKFAAIAAGLWMGFFVMKSLFPDAFVAYAAREEGKYLAVSAENKGRIISMFTDVFGDTDIWSMFGHGLGTMSNGSDKISQYAYGIRRTGFWTETDQATTIYEGGFYLMLVWNGFRLWVIAHTAGRLLRGMKGEYAIPGIFCQGYIVLVGLTGNLGIQPPLAIWWWMAVGVSTLLWQKSNATESGSDVPPPELPGLAAVTARKVRGRSVYAEQLHSGMHR